MYKVLDIVNAVYLYYYIPPYNNLLEYNSHWQDKEEAENYVRRYAKNLSRAINEFEVIEVK